MRIRCALAFAAFLGAKIVPAQAEDRTPAEEAFYEGRELMEEERYDEACEAFSRAFEFDPAPGTLLNLALCEESLGDLATAHATYLEAAELAAIEDDETREQAGLDRAEELEPRLSRLKIELMGDIPEDLEIIKGGEDITDKLGEAQPVDPGEHELEATAPGRLSWQGRASVFEERETVRVTIPELEIKEEVAEWHHQEGAELYRAGQIEDAIEQWRLSYELDPDPYLLFDIASAYREIGNSEQALSHFRQYLDEDPDGQAAGEAERRIQELEGEHIAGPEELPTLTSDDRGSRGDDNVSFDAPAEPTRSRHALGWGIGLAAGGAAIAIAGQATRYSGASARRDAVDQAEGGELTAVEYEDLTGSADRQHQFGMALLVTGIVASGVGASLISFDIWEGARAEADVAAAGPGVAGLTRGEVSF